MDAPENRIELRLLNHAGGSRLVASVVAAMLAMHGAWWTTVVIPSLDFAVVFTAFAVVGVALAQWLPRSILRARQPEGAAITWDEGGVRQWEGAKVRTAIAWEDARVTVRRINRGSSRNSRWYRHIQVDIVDRSGRRIMVTTGFGLPFGVRRRVVAAFEDLERLATDAERHGTKGGPSSDPGNADPTRPGRGLLRLISVAATVVVAVAVALGSVGIEQGVQSEFQRTLLVVAAVAAWVLLARPTRELLALRRDGAHSETPKAHGHLVRAVKAELVARTVFASLLSAVPATYAVADLNTHDPSTGP